MHKKVFCTYYKLHTCFFFIIICGLYCFSYNLIYPGSFSRDSSFSYNESVSNIYSNHHPPMMAWVWRLFSSFSHDGKPVILAMNLGFFWGCVYLQGIINSRILPVWAYLGLFIWTIPPVLAMTNAVWKDTCMAVALMFACLLLHYHQRLRKPLTNGMLLFIIMLLFFSVALRHNAITAMLPITYWLVSVICENRWGILRKLVMALAICIALFLGKTAFENAIVAKYIMPAQENMLFDLGYMSQRIDSPLLPKYVYQDSQMDFEQFKAKIHFGWSGRYMSNDFGTEDPKKWADLRQAYFAMLRTYPLEYMKHRWDIFINSLGWNSTYWPYIWGAGEDSPNRLKAFGRTYLRYAEPTGFFKAYVWLILVIVLTIAAYFKNILPNAVRMPVLYLNLSAIMMTIPYYLLLPSPDFRYYYWQILVVIFSFMLLLPAWDEKRIICKMRNKQHAHHAT